MIHFLIVIIYKRTVQVTAKKKWTEIAEVLKLSAKCTGAAHALMHHYKGYLSDYEQYFRQRISENQNAPASTASLNVSITLYPFLLQGMYIPFISVYLSFSSPHLFVSSRRRPQALVALPPRENEKRVMKMTNPSGLILRHQKLRTVLATSQVSFFSF